MKPEYKRKQIQRKYREAIQQKKEEKTYTTKASLLAIAIGVIIALNYHFDPKSPSGEDPLISIKKVE
ncbi:hypothetical protein HPB58_17715 [Priestia filamentosa]|uniref:hypothetical protein n=1 Tax=Priestia filamentosa TaxID=1402861 RepID=UPI001FB4DD03|nr:hypothetical protein [Priestia filamentosa]UOE59145.1 hypothetical protein HPB58_17715 [Priestia filamentosa]